MDKISKFWVSPVHNDFDIADLATRVLRESLSIGSWVICHDGNITTVEVAGEKLRGITVRNIRAGGVSALIHQLLAMRPEGGRALFADYINPKIRETLISNNINYIDCCGNCHINLNNIFISVGGKRPDKLPNSISNKAFESAGIKLVYSLLCYPGLVRQPYREIARVTGISVGAIGNAMTGLIDLNYVIETGGGGERRLNNTKALLGRWVVAFVEKEKPKLLIGTYCTDDRDWWRGFDICLFHGKWGGEIGASKYQSYLQPEVATVYMDDEYRHFIMNAARLRKYVPQERTFTSRVEIYKPFVPKLNIGWERREDVVNPILVYADLMASNNTRNADAAQVLYDEYIARHIGEN